MSLYRLVGIALQCVLLCSVKLSKSNAVTEDTNAFDLPHIDPSYPNHEDIPCHNTRERNDTDDATIPPNVCGMCPAGEHDLEPCECISIGGEEQGGLISIQCGPSTHWTTVDEIKEMISSAADDFITTHVLRFTMTGTNVTGTLKQDVWGPLNFHQVILDNNKIGYVDNHVFLNSKETLTLLSMKNNEINYFHWEQLMELPHLYQLVLQGNNLSFIPSDNFPDIEMAYLDLSRNQINYIGPYAFNNLRKLMKLNLSHNQLTSLDDYTLSITQHDPDQNTLRIILSNNMISDIRKNAFYGVHPIDIDLSYNRLTTVDPEVFIPLITGNQYYLTVELHGNPIVCDCSIEWMVTIYNRTIFGNFLCYDEEGNPTDYDFADLDPSDFAECHGELTPEHLTKLH